MSLLITGADGYLGRRLLAKALAETDEPIVAWVRAKDDSEFADKKSSLASTIGGSQRVQCVAGDLTADDPFAQVATSDIRRIVHSAAVTAFNVEEERGRAINTLGTVRVMEFAARCRKIERIACLSTIYSSGLRPGDIREEPGDETAGFANHYERSKWAAENEVLRRFDGLPWQIQRVATVLCDDDDGRVVQFNVIHKIWRLLNFGLLPVMPGDGGIPLYLVTGDFATEAIWTLLNKAPTHSFFHVAHDHSTALSLREWIDCAYDQFLKDETFRKRRILKPLFTDEVSFYRMADTATMFSRDSLKHVVQLVRPFAKQMFVHKRVHTNRTSEFVGRREPDFRTLIERTIRQLMKNEWAIDSASHRMSDGGA